jgi:regulator of CtrA degradation
MAAPGNTAFFDRTYREAIALLHEARAYLAHAGATERAELPLIERLRYAHETIRLTARLIDIMAWLLHQRAVHGGEMDTAYMARQLTPLASRNSCMREGDPLAAPKLQALLDRSQKLYLRIANLDEMLRRDADLAR